MWNSLGLLLRDLALGTHRQKRFEARRRAIRLAFDHALEQVAGVPSLHGREASMIDARLAVKASNLQCGPAARAAEAYLTTNGIARVVFHSIGGHYVLLDRLTHLIYDLETPQGCRDKRELPIWSRSEELSRHSSAALAEDIFERYASAWLTHRQSHSRTSPTLFSS